MDRIRSVEHRPQMRFWLALWIACWISSASVAEKPETILILTDPPMAVVKYETNAVGNTGQPFPRARLGEKLPQSGLWELHVSLPGYKPDTILVKASAWPNQREFPATGPLALKPNSLTGYLRHYRPHVLSGLILLAGAAAFNFTRRFRSPAPIPPGGHATLVGAKIGGYTLTSALGGGGMARVYRAEKAGSTDTLAMKVLMGDSQADVELLRRFKREVNVCRTMDHPNIVRIYDWGEERGVAYLVMELLDGGTLRQKMGQPWPRKELRAVVEPLFAAVAYAHSRTVVHRDLKPENIMFTGNGLLKVVDFGLGRQQSSSMLTQTGTVLGTPAYMSPEQIQGTSFDPSIDQYALGIILYELLTGRLPFEADDPVQLIFKHVGENAPPPSRFREDVTDAEDAIVLRMLCKSPDQRFASVEEASAYLLHQWESQD